MRVPNHALRVDKKHGTHVNASCVIENTVSLAHCAVGPVIRKQRERQPAQLFRPGLEARSRVSADLQDLDPEGLELIVVRTEPGNLVLSSTGESKRQKSDHRAPSAKT